MADYLKIINEAKMWVCQARYAATYTRRAIMVRNAISAFESARIVRISRRLTPPSQA